jgi:hypothetical protein
MRVTLRWGSDIPGRPAASAKQAPARPRCRCRDGRSDQGGSGDRPAAEGQASGIIEGYYAEVSRIRAGLGLTVFIGLKVEGHSRETSSRIEQALLAVPAVVTCYLVSGSDDFLAGRGHSVRWRCNMTHS